VIAQAGGRVAVVTGASRGLGAGLAVHFAAAGMHLALCARHTPALAAPPGAATPFLAAVDVTDRAALERFADEVVNRFGRIDLWVNNAGLLGDIRRVADADPAASARTVEVNVNGTLHGSAVFAGHVRRRSGPGVLINISSGAAAKPYVGWGAYCASKAAVDQLTRVLALEEARHGLRAYALSPGLVDTDMQAAIRAADECDFPEVERFRRVAADDQFNSPAWVAEQILAIAFGGDDPGQVTVRLGEQPAAGDAG
jgi:NAD(P)-dependent dehydrogenase (short-subunit alcohol dehydrogenase family)